ncbi:hypothetical protein NXY49_00065 [Bacteroides fragilis]|nr:hypothetical protein [Bacteroides fragilis]
MKTIYILLITVLSWSLQAMHRPMRQNRMPARTVFPVYIPICGVTFPAEYCTSQFQDRGRTRMPSRRKLAQGDGGHPLHNKSPEVIIPTKKWKKLLQKAAGKEIFIRITLLREGNGHTSGYQGYHIERTDRCSAWSTGCCTRI